MFFSCIKLDTIFLNHLVESSTKSILVTDKSCSIDYPVSYHLYTVILPIKRSIPALTPDPGGSASASCYANLTCITLGCTHRMRTSYLG